MKTDGRSSVLESLMDEMSLMVNKDHSPEWRFEEANDRFVWILDGDRAAGLLDRRDMAFELRCPGPFCDPPPTTLPRYYHTITYTGVRVMLSWRYNVAKTASDISYGIEKGDAVFNLYEKYDDGSRSHISGRLRYDPGWDGYVMDVETLMDARIANCPLEYCNVLPAGIGDSRPGMEKFTHTFWRHPEGLKKMKKNPLWWVSAGGHDISGCRRIEEGGFIGFGPDEWMNPVVEIVHSDPPTGAGTCDNLQDEHIYIISSPSDPARRSGWFHLYANYRLFSIPTAMAEEIINRADDLECGPMLAWKFQYPPLINLPYDLTGVELPGSSFYGKSDWSKPIPWDKPYNGVIWTASPDPASDIYYDRKIGHDKPGSIRMRVDGMEKSFWPGSGHTLYTEEGHRYRYSMWIKTEGNAYGWIEAAEVLFRYGDRDNHPSDKAPPNSDWTKVDVEYTAQGEEAPFAITVLKAEGNGSVWFTEMEFDDVGRDPFWEYGGHP